MVVGREIYRFADMLAAVNLSLSLSLSLSCYGFCITNHYDLNILIDVQN
jgi:hypothetical protein